MSGVFEALNVIDGEVLEGSSGEFLHVINPATGEPISRVTLSNADDVDRAVDAAHRAQPNWASLPHAERGRVLNEIVDHLERHVQELMDLEIADTGKPITAAAEEEFPGILEAARLFANAWRVMSAPSAGEHASGAVTYVQREPLGVVSAITPWNYPLWQALWKIIPAIATGNAVVVKPSEVTPRSTTRFVEMIQEYLPSGLVNVVNGRGSDLGDALTLHEHVELVSFTGSTRTGRIIARNAAERPKRTVMELGGNAPVIVCADVDVAGAAQKITGSALYNAGQECQASTRILVHESIADAFVAALRDSFEAVTVGDPLDPDTVLGPLSSAEHLAKVVELVELGKQEGTLVTGGEVLDRPGFFFTPTIITGLQQNSRVVQEEIFGPVVTVQTFSDPEEAIRLANDVEYGLAGSVWTKDSGFGLELLGRLDFGNVWLNTHLVLSPAMPIGGFKASGFGKEGGLLGIEEYTRVKQIGLALGS
ncbi:aldehyde dehydrogenase family protein [Leucobacter sp. GX24907]